MVAPRQGKLLLAAVAVAGLAVATTALVLAAAVGDPLPPVFRQRLTGEVLLIVIVWCPLAWLVRRLIIGKLPKIGVGSPMAVAWGASRFTLFIATMLLLLGSLVFLAVGTNLGPAFFRAFISLVVLTAFTGIVGGAARNTVLVLKALETPRK
jgi:hypothetical protein